MRHPRINLLVTLCITFFASFSGRQAKADPPGAGWTLTFSDEFNGQSAYDTTKWKPYYVSGAKTLTGNGEKEWYVDSPQNIDVTSGTSVRLTALANNPVTGYTYSSGMLSSHNYFNQAFGYMECRAKVPSGKGLWPAFWTLEGSKEAAYNWPPEIDIMEYIGTASPKVDYMTNHYSGSYPLDGGSNLSLASTYNCSKDLSQDFHIFAVNWEPDKITWYVDGVERFNVTTNVPYTRAMHVILNLAVGGYWPGNPDGTTVFPAIFEVDYVRVYSRPLPAPWQAQDIGSPTSAGRTYASSSGLFNVYGSGTGISGTSDQCQFSYLPLNGDGTIIARVKNEVGTNSIYTSANVNAKAGLMIRESLDANSTNAFMALRPVVSGTAGGNIFSARAATSGTTTTTVLNNAQSVPSWLKLVRSGTTFTGYTSTDGTNWVASGTTAIGMATTAYAGFAVTSSGTAQKATAQFDNISITGDTPVLTSITLAPPSSVMEVDSLQQFAATALDQYGNAMSPQPTFTWNASGGGSIDAGGMFTSGTTNGGPYSVTATSGTVSSTAAVTITTTPNVPTNLVATAATMLNGWVKLTWTDNSNIETGYAIQRYNSSTGNYDPLTTVGANVTTYTNSGLNMPSGPYTYRILATGSFGNDSAYSSPVTISIPTPPNGPTGLAAAPGTSKVVLTWNAVSGASNYNIQRATASAGPYSAIKNNNTTTTYTDSTAAAGTTYYYKVNYNVNGVGASYYCSPVSATPTGALATVTVTPGSATVDTGTNQQFTAMGTDSFGNNVIPQPTFTWATTGGGTIDASGLFSATTAGGPFAVTATSGTINGAASLTVTNPIPAAPSNVTPTWATMLNGWLKLTWTDNSSNETGFTIQTLSGTTWNTYATVAANTTTYTRTGLNMPSGPYNLRVIATGTAGNSAPSNQVTFSIPTPPTMPDTLVATPGSGQVALSWTAVSGANNYNIQRATASGGPYTVIKYNNAGTTYTDTSVTNGTTYYYKVNYNVNGVGASYYCSPVSATP